jgi:DNA repair protein RadC
MMIADLPMDERPREKMLAHGAAPLSDADLVALLLGSGRRGKGATSLARELLADGLIPLSQRDIDDLARVPGVGKAKATRIMAAFELSQRLLGRNATDRVEYSAAVLGPQLVKTFQFRQEHLGAAFLDSRKQIIRHVKRIYVGTIEQALLSPREIIRHAVLLNAVGVVLYHNHPSGVPKPSGPDQSATQKVRDSLKLCELELIDHLIIGSSSYLSMKEEQLF